MTAEVGFEGVPGPSPWYLRSGAEIISGFRWRPAGDKSLSSGKTLLLGSNGPVAVLNFYNYVMALDSSSLLIWHQAWSESGVTEPVRLLLVHPARLTPLPSDLDRVYETMNEHRTAIQLGGQPTAEICLSTTNCADERQANFPVQLRSVEELLILCHSSGIATGAAGERGDSALLVAHPPTSAYRLYPQDWFNSGGRDYGYEWITCVVRDLSTGRVHGEGIRIAPFVLDDSLRCLRR